MVFIGFCVMQINMLPIFVVILRALLPPPFSLFPSFTFSIPLILLSISHSIRPHCSINNHLYIWHILLLYVRDYDAETNRDRCHNSNIYMLYAYSYP